MDVLTEADKAATPGVYWAIIMIGLVVGTFVIGRSLNKRLRNLKNRETESDL
jgi:uncharacterized membrane-anchored protein YhcB (DUF1043 family)